MTEPLDFPAYLERWTAVAQHDLSTSDSQTMPLLELLELADYDDTRRWHDLGLGYATPRGSSWLREAVAARHAHLGAEDILCCAGAQEATWCAARALLTSDDHAVIVLPIYGPTEQAVTSITMATGVPLGSDDWRLDVDRVAAALRPNTKLVLMNFPNSPTGASLDAATLSGLVALCRRHGIWLMNDEVYRETDVSADRSPMIADLYERGISINSLSKGFGLPGLRVGWVACPDRDVIARTVREKTRRSGCLASSSEVLAHVALGAAAKIIARSRAIGGRNLALLDALCARYPDVFTFEGERNCAFAFVRYHGEDGADAFAVRMARDAGLLVLPSTMWQTPLAPAPADYIRIGLGHHGSELALDALSARLALSSRRKAAPRFRDVVTCSAHCANQTRSNV